MTRNVVALSFVLCALSLSTVEAEQPPIHDGHWWVKQQMRRQYGYVAGTSLCLRDELSTPTRMRTVDDGLSYIDKYYRDQTVRGDSILKVIREAPPLGWSERSPENEVFRVEDGFQTYPEKYGYYDGMWWSSPAGQQGTGFVEGYLDCLPKARDLYPEPIETYVRLIDKWYSGEDEDRTYEKIPVVLGKFRK